MSIKERRARVDAIDEIVSITAEHIRRLEGASEVRNGRV